MVRDLALKSRFAARVFDQYAAGPRAEGVLFRAAKDEAPAEILVYDFIGSDYFGDGVTAKGVQAALADADGGPVRVRVNSPGGDVFEGMAIHTALRSYAGGVEVVVDGLAASAASIIALAGGSVAMNDGAMMMIHNAWTMVAGDRNKMLKQAHTLEKIDGQLAGIYESFSGKDGWAAAMDAETWYTAQEAVDAGLATSVIPAPKRPTKNEGKPVVAVVAEAPDPDATARRARRARLAATI